jgi:hypothetical protein
VRAIYLMFHGRVNRTIGAFDDEREMEKFIAYTLNKPAKAVVLAGHVIRVSAFDALPDANPLFLPIHCFQTAREAATWFSLKPDRWEPTDVVGVSSPVWEGL